MNVEKVRVILERTFGMPVSESDAQIVLDRLVEFQAVKEAAQQPLAPDAAKWGGHYETCPANNGGTCTCGY